MYFNISQTAFLLGVCTTTIRRWDKAGKIKCIRTVGGHRRIHKDEIKRIIAGKKRSYIRSKRKRKVVIYTRVSSHDQKKHGDLDRQKGALRKYCENYNLDVGYDLSDVASGLNAKRRGIAKLCKLIAKGKISHVVITYKDRLTRFGFDYLKNYFDSYGTKIITIKTREIPSVQQEMVDDMIAIITSFSGKIHGMRGGKKKKSKN